MRPQNLALAVVTIERPSAVLRLIKSARARFPRMPVYVADQSRRIEHMRALYDAYRVQLIEMPFDCGVSASRNRLVEVIEEEFFVLCDDDFIIRSYTHFDEALAILVADDEIGVVGGCLRDISGAVEYRRHWEMHLHYDQPGRTLTSVPIYHYAPAPCILDDVVVFYRCDAVMNFAVFRRRIFSDRVKWDPRIKINGEHEDFYLNLKQIGGGHKVVYLPSMLADHDHPSGYAQYKTELRGRSDGWRLFMEKWDIRQYLEIGAGTRTIDDPDILVDPATMQASYNLATVPFRQFDAYPTERVSCFTEAELSELPLFFRYDPIRRRNAGLVVWYLAQRSEQMPALPKLPVFLRWFDADNNVLAWRVEGTHLDLGGPYWQPLPIDIPLAPSGNAWLRFEINADLATGSATIAIGYVFDELPTQSNEVACLTSDVLALSCKLDFRAELTSNRTLTQLLSSDSTTAEAPLETVPAPAGRPMLIVPICPNLAGKTVLFIGWRVEIGRAMFEARVPDLASGWPSHVLLPMPRDAAAARVVHTDSTGQSTALHLLEDTSAPRCGHLRARNCHPTVTAVVTSCGRPDLLARTLESFFAFNTFPHMRTIIIEDGDRDQNAVLMRRFHDHHITWLSTGERVGQIYAIDLAYSRVETDAIFHLEDDWEFHAPGFIEKSLAVLDADRHCLQVWIRALNDTNGHPLAPELERVGGMSVRRLLSGYQGAWDGFSFNPGLRRTADYKRLKSYSRHVRFDPSSRGAAESSLSGLYRDLNMHAFILADNGGQGYCRHIGFGRSIMPPRR